MLAGYKKCCIFAVLFINQQKLYTDEKRRYFKRLPDFGRK